MSMLATGFLCGCSDRSYETPSVAWVSGQILMDGEPLANAQVSFYASGTPRPATGSTNESGDFILNSFGNYDGAVLGEHVVVVTPKRPSITVDNTMSGEEVAAMLEEQAANQANTESEIPKKFMVAATSPIRVRVEAEGTSVTIDLADYP